MAMNMAINPITNVSTLPCLLRNKPASAHWYAIYTCARHEKWVAKQLEQSSLETFLPLHRSIHQWKDRKKLVEQALFPSYVFVKIDPAERIRVLQTPGVVRIVDFQGEPAALPEAEIEALRSGLNQKLNAEPCEYLRAGNRIRVIRGPLIGAEGIFVHFKGKPRVVITLDVLMRSVAVEIDAAYVEPLPN